VGLERIGNPDELEALRTIVQWHRKKTRSWRAAQILAEWSRMQRAFWRVLPRGIAGQGQATIRAARDYMGAHTHNIEPINEESVAMKP